MVSLAEIRRHIKTARNELEIRNHELNPRMHAGVQEEIDVLDAVLLLADRQASQVAREAGKMLPDE